ncbi:MAG TPA: hypothetical protein VGN79_00010 [Devosia sp.]|jgi:uncharacterized paraquat-inducible protein A|nr:hypothetical protein [Devosia sp.]
MASDAFTCTKCNMPLEADEPHTDQSVAFCPTCGTKFGTLGELKRAAFDLATMQARKTFEKS